MSKSAKYSKTAIVLHWLIGLAIIAMLALGWYMTDLPREAPKQAAFDLFDLGIFTWQVDEPVSPRNFYYNFHKSVGITLLALVIFRIYWRITHTPPAMLKSYKAWETKLATAVHHGLYFLMFALPLSGLIMAMSGKYGVMWFGLDFLPGLDNKPLREIFHETHEILGTLTLLVILVHIAGALKHKIIDKDSTMERMTF